MKQTKAKQSVTLFGHERENLGSSLHTAMRKCCDSTASSLVWNLIHLEDMDEAWSQYLDNAWTELKKTNEPGHVPQSLKNAAELLQWGNHARAALKCGFEWFSEDDWLGMASYLMDE